MHALHSRSLVYPLAVAAMLAGASPSPAGNAMVTNVALTEAGGKVAARFDLAWDKSWRDEAGHDACWVFVKYSPDNGATWRHADLAASGVNPAGFDAGAGAAKLEIVVPADKKGAFIRRAAPGKGSATNTGISLPLASGGKDAPKAKSLVRVCALEMAYVAKGNFQLGTPGKETGHFHDGAGATTPFLVKGEGPIAISNAPGCLWGTGTVYEDQVGPAGALPAAFPKGFDAFYLMKTELSQRQYCDFLNTLTAKQQNHRHDAKLHFGVFANHLPARNYIKKTAGSPAFFGCDANNNAGPATNAVAAKLNEADDGEWGACTYLSWMDLAAYLDWAGLRPMTELEFEKACRGPLPPVANEYAWGDAVLRPATSFKNLCTAAEIPDNGNCNVLSYSCYNNGAIRCGSFADAGAGRTNTGAGYCGALDLSGNAGERAVTVGNAAGRAFTGLHGDGTLSANGQADTAAWPGLVDGEVTGALGAGSRGGHWMNSLVLCASDRTHAAAMVTVRYMVNGGRGARSAP